MKVFTIGHSTRSFDDFLQTLSQYGIDMVVDVRRIPESQKFPHFDRKFLEKELPSHGIAYSSFTDIGGFRKGGYKAFAASPQFKELQKKLLSIMKGKHAVLLCSEILWYRCHRRYIAEELVKSGFPVVHIYNKEKTQNHVLHDAEIEEKMLMKIYCDENPIEEGTPEPRIGEELKESLEKF